MLMLSNLDSPFSLNWSAQIQSWNISTVHSINLIWVNVLPTISTEQFYTFYTYVGYLGYNNVNFQCQAGISFWPGLKKRIFRNLRPPRAMYVRATNVSEYERR